MNLPVRTLLSLSFMLASHFAIATETTPTEKKTQTEDLKQKIDPNLKPLLFAVDGNELKLQPPQVNYDMQSSKGEELKIGSLIYKSDSFKAEIKDSRLEFTWDKELISSGYITMFNHLGKSAWSHQASGEGKWSIKLNEEKSPALPSSEKFRFCMMTGSDKAFTSLCTRWYGVQDNKGQKSLGFYKVDSSPRIILDNEESRLQGVKQVSVGNPVHLLAILNSGAAYEFSSEPVQPIIRDLVKPKDKELFEIHGELPKPLGMTSEVLPGRQYSSLVKSIGFEDTILPDVLLWRGEFAPKKASFYFPGKSGGVFEYPYEIENAPREEERMFVSKRVLTGTYLDQDQTMVENEKGEQKSWLFSTPEKYKYNRVYLDVPGEKATHKAYMDVYRGSPREASLRLTGTVTNEGGTVAFAEGHVSWWFNDLFGWQNYYLSKQRWGVSAKQFMSLTSLPAELDTGESESVSISVLDVDLRYRLNPGLWERDETVGLILGYEKGTLGGYDVGKIGGGLFWARSMPRVFDDLFNKISFLRYPKWVDMEFINYFSSTNSDITLNGDFVLNFHGKVLWTPQYFGEAGFGIKSYSFTSGPEQEKFQLYTFYGTVGVGINF